MDSLATLHTALDAAFSKLNESTSSETGFSNSSVQDASLEITDRATWAEVVCGQEKDHRTGTDVQVTSHYTHDGHDKTTYQKHQQLDHNGQRRHPSENKYKQEVEGNNEAWQTVVGKHHHLNSHQESCASAKQYHKVSKEQCQKFKRHLDEQEYAEQVGSSINVNPTQEELENLSAACARLWELDLNRLSPGRDYVINCGEGKKIYEKEDMAENSLFHHVRRDVFDRPTYARFFSLLDNYNASEEQPENITGEERQEEIAFIEEISRTAPILYTFRYLVEKREVLPGFQEFKQQLKSLWFGMHARGTHSTSCAFEHVFVGEVKNKSEKQVSGFHNWIKFYVEEANGRVDYQGYILPRKRSHSLPDGHTQLISVQFLWNGILKPLSSTFIGVSPEFELALYTLCFYAGQEDNFVQVGPYSVNIKCYRYGRDKIGSAFPIAED